MKSLYSVLATSIIILVQVLNFSCKKFVEIDPPRTDLVKSTVFTSDATAEAAMADIYFQIRNDGFGSGGGSSISLNASLSSDELIYNGVGSSTAQDYDQINTNSIRPNNIITTRIWSNIYNIIYRSNSVLEGIMSSGNMSDPIKKRLEGEAKFIRAFCHFYLVNLWGDVPLTLTTNYQQNNTSSRTSEAQVYQQIISDLKDAQNLLPSNYAFTSNQRVKPNKYTATALLARVYLYLEDWVNAELQATEIINNTSLYQLESNLMTVFRSTSKEPIFQLWSDAFPNDRNTFFVFSSGPTYGSVRPQFVSSFETGDNRWVRWGQTRIVQGNTFYGVLKYRDFSTPPLDFSTVLRLAEQYLIRSEARAKQGKITGNNSAESDINVIRNRAGLGNTIANTQADMLLAVELERRSELFTEWGHRWFDLKRTGRAAAVLNPIKPNWQAYKELFPIPEEQLINNPNISQNPGY